MPVAALPLREAEKGSWGSGRQAGACGKELKETLAQAVTRRFIGAEDVAEPGRKGAEQQKPGSATNSSLLPFYPLPHGAHAGRRLALLLPKACGEHPTPPSMPPGLGEGGEVWVAAKEAGL